MPRGSERAEAAATNLALAWTEDALRIIAEIRRYEKCHPKGALCLLPLYDAIAQVRLPL